MKVDVTIPIAGSHPHKVEVGGASFGGRSVRIYFYNALGKFNHKSPEVPMACVQELVEAVANNDELSVKELARDYRSVRRLDHSPVVTQKGEVNE